ncbi:MAG: hypothetical protein WA056_09225 [Gallionella sp.]
MANLGFVEAFAKFGAKLDNPMWAVSAIANDNALVISCWAHYFKSGGSGVVRYVDSLSRWGGNELGNKLLENHLSNAFAEKLPVRMVVATAENPDTVEREHDASKVKKTFHVRDDIVGRVTDFDGDNFVIEFRRPS